MNPRVIILSIAISVICSSCSMTVKSTGNERALIDSIQELLEVKAQLAEKYWPEFNKEDYCAPIVFYTDSACYVLNPKQEFLDEFTCKRIDAEDIDLYRTELLDSLPFHMETHVELDNDTTFYGRTPYCKCSTLEIVHKTNQMYSDNSCGCRW